MALDQIRSWRLRSAARRRLFFVLLLLLTADRCHLDVAIAANDDGPIFLLGFGGAEGAAKITLREGLPPLSRLPWSLGHVLLSKTVEPNKSESAAQM